MNTDTDLPPRVVFYGHKSHPMYKQWVKMLDSATDPANAMYPSVGAKGITVMHRWFDFGNFITDNRHLFDDEPSRPANLRRAYIARVNLKAGFNPKNLLWVTRGEATTLQPHTILVDTVHGKGMTLRGLEEYLKDHEGDDLPQGATIHNHWVRRYNADTGKTERMLEALCTVQAIKLHELRRRYKAGLDLLAPVREYGTERLDNEIESVLVSNLDSNRRQIPDDAPYYVKNRGFV